MHVYIYPISFRDPRVGEDGKLKKEFKTSFPVKYVGPFHAAFTHILVSMEGKESVRARFEKLLKEIDEL